MNPIRVGNFTSSEIVALTSKGRAKGTFGKPALTYIEECNMERRLGKSLSEETYAKPLLWGKLVESFAFEKLGLEYSLNSDETLVHPDYDFWVGSPDGFKYDEGKTVLDEKCPYTLKSFCQLVEPLYKGLNGMDAMNYIRKNHKEGEKYYQQLVSNSCITQSRFAELIIYCPYQSDLKELRELAEGDKRFYFIWAASDDELPYLNNGGYYKDINIIRFEVPQEDKDHLTECAERAGKLLDPRVTLITHDPSLNATIVN